MKTKSLKLALIVAIALFAVSVLTLFAPIALAATPETVKLDSDVEQAYVVDGGKNVTIDLNGFTMKSGVTATGAGTVVTITDSSDAQTGTVNGMYAVSALDGAKVVINNANVNATMYAIYANDGAVVVNGGTIASQTGYGVVLFGSDNVGASFTLNGGAINGSVGLTATGDDQFDNCNVTINGGTITAANDQIAVYWASTGMLKVTGGTITGATAVYVKSGSVDITGGTFVATGASYQYRYTANGAVATGDALVVENANQGVYQAITSASVANATFTSQNAKAIASYAPVASDKVVSFLNVGVVSNTAVETALLGEGYVVSQSNGSYTVVEGNAVQVGSKNYGTFQRGFEAALATGEKLVLLQNIDLADQTLVVPANKTFAIDLNGFVLSGSSSQRNHQLIINNGTMVVEDNSTAANGEIRYTFTGTGDASFGTGNYTISNRGHLTVNSGTINNATAAMTHMRDAIDNNSTVRDAVLVINGGAVKCDTYMAIRQFANSTTHANDVVINDGSVGKIFVQGSNANAQKASLQVRGGEVVGLFVSFELNSQNLALDVDTSCITSDYMHFYLDSTHKVYTDANGNLSALQSSQVAQVGANYYSFDDAIAKANETGENVVLIADATMDKATNVTANVTVDLNGKTLTLTGAALNIKANVTFANGTVDLSDAVSVAHAYVIVYTGATLTFDKVDFVGDGYSTKYGVFYVDGTVNVNKSTINLKNDLTGGGVFKADKATAQINLVDSEVSFKDAGIGFINAVLNVNNTKLTIEGGKNAINGCTLTVTDSEVEIFGSNERGITVTNGDVVIVNSTVNVHDMAEASVRFKKNYTFQVKGNSNVEIESIIIDSATGAGYDQLVVVDSSASCTEFLLTVDGVAYTNALLGFASVTDGSVVTLHSGYDFEQLPLSFTCDVTVNGVDNLFASTAAQVAVVNGAKVVFNNVDFENANGAAILAKGNATVMLNGCQINAKDLVAFEGTGSVVVIDNQTVIAANDVAVKAVVQDTTVYASDLTTLLAFLNNTYTQVEITLYADQILTETQIYVASGSTYTINLNGNNITGTNTTAGKFLVENHGTLTINGKGTVAYSYVGAQDASYGKGNGTIANYGTLVVNNATLRNDTAAMSHSLNVIDNNSTLANASATLNSVKVLLANNGIAIRQFANSEVNENNVVLNGASEVSGKAAMQVMLPSNTAEARKATLTINDDTIVKTTAANGYAFYVYSAGNSLADVTINVNGGEFYGWFIVGYSAKPVTVTETLNVTGGTFVDNYIYTYADPAVVTTNNYNVTGGSYAYAIDQFLVAEGHVIAANKDNTYSVVTDLAYVEDYVSEDAKEALKAYMQDMIANGFYSQVGVANLNAMWQNACTKLDQATTIEQTQVIVNETKQEFTYVVNKWEEAALQAQAMASIKQYAATNGIAVSDVSTDAITASATAYGINAALVEAMKAVDQLVADKLAAEFAQAVTAAVEEVTLYAQAIGVNVDTTAVAAATNHNELATAVAAAKAAVDATFDAYQQDAVEALYGTDNANEAHVTTAMVASIYAAQTTAEVDVALQVATAEIAQIKEYKTKINETYTGLQSAIDAANTAATKATEAATAAADAAAKAQAAGVSAEAAKTAAESATAAATEAKAKAEAAIAAAEAAKLAAESGKATVQELATAVANAQAAAEAAKTAAQAAEAAANKAADKAQTTEVKVYATTAATELQTWLTNFLDTLLTTAPVASNDATTANYREQLQSQIANLYTQENQALILSYYDQAMSAMELATTKEEVDYALATFKANVALVDVLQNVGGTAPVETNYKTWLMALAAVEALLAIAVLCLLFKKKASITVELPIEEESTQEQQSPAVEQAVAPVVQEVEPQAAEETVEEAVEETVEEETEETEETEEADEDDESEEAVVVAEGEDPFANLQNRTSKTFDERLAEADDETKAIYKQIQSFFLCYKKVKERRSKKFASFRKGRELLAKVVLRGKSFNVFLALNPDDYAESVYHHKAKGDKKAYELVPMMVRVRSPRSLKKLQRLIDEMLAGEEKVEYIPVEEAVVEATPVVEETVVETPAPVLDDGEDQEIYDDDVEDAEEDESAEETEQGEVDPFANLQNRTSKTFDERLAEADDETKAIYKQIQSFFLCYKKVKQRTSKKFVSFRKGRQLLSKVVLRGKSFNVFLALNPDDYAESVYHHKAKGDKKAYELVPMMVRVRSPRSLKKLQRLIDEMLAGEEKIEYVPETVAVVEQVVEAAPVEVVEETASVVEVAEEVAPAQDADPFADLQNRKSKTFDERLAEAEEETRAIYEEIKAAFLAHKKVKERQSKKFVSFRKGRNLLAKVVLRGKSFNVFLALNPEEYAETVYHHKAKGDKKAYELVPMMVRVRSPRSIKKAKRLIADVVAKADAPQA